MLDFYRGRRVFMTGHTGFKGMWLCRMLLLAGAEVCGYALEAPTAEGRALLKNSNVLSGIVDVRGDVRDRDRIISAMKDFHPEIVFHLAAQPLVLESYRDPVTTYETNVMGTVNVLEAVRHTDSVKSFVNVTTDKVYENKEWVWGYRETEALNGFDPYSNSKSCSELVTDSYKKSFLNESGIAVSTARAGNVIGGGDFSENRIIPDCVRAAISTRQIEVRNPNSVRPYQHVVEPLSAYLLIAEKQYEDIKYAGCYNVGPNQADCITTGELVEQFCKEWTELNGDVVSWHCKQLNGPHEANFLKLDCAKIRNSIGWKPKMDVKRAVKMVVEWTVCYSLGNDVSRQMDKQIKEYINNGCF